MHGQSDRKPSEYEFHQERSRCVDAFAEAERRVNVLLDWMVVKRGGEPLKQRIANLRKVSASPKYSKVAKAGLDAALEKLEAYLPLRADIVHGCLQLAYLSNDVRACFANARQDCGPGEQMRVFTIADLRKVASLIDEVASSLNPPSSPPRPSPGAAGGP